MIAGENSLGIGQFLSRLSAIICENFYFYGDFLERRGLSGYVINGENGLFTYLVVSFCPKGSQRAQRKNIQSRPVYGLTSLKDSSFLRRQESRPTRHSGENRNLEKQV